MLLDRGDHKDQSMACHTVTRIRSRTGEALLRRSICSRRLCHCASKLVGTTSSHSERMDRSGLESWFSLPFFGGRQWRRDTGWSAPGKYCDCIQHFQYSGKAGTGSIRRSAGGPVEKVYFSLLWGRIGRSKDVWNDGNQHKRRKGTVAPGSPQHD